MCSPQALYSNEQQQFGHLTRATLGAIESAVPFDNHLIYAILHEPIYCQGYFCL